MNCKKYIIRNARKLPIHTCLIADGYLDMGLTQCMIIRKQPGGKYTFALLLVDRFCLGVKNAAYNCNMDDDSIRKLTEGMSTLVMPEEVSPAYFHNLVYAALDYASELGFSPHKDFAVAEYVLEPGLVDDGIDEIEMGKEGKPLYISGPYDNVPKIISTLNRTVGAGNYEFIAKPEQLTGENF